MEAPPLTPLATAVLHVSAPERALLVGCGDGDAALFLAREFPAARVRAVDHSAERIRAVQSRVGLDPEGRLAFKRASGRRLPFPDDHFDLVAQVEGRVAAGELRRVLRDGGYLILAPARPPGPLVSLRSRLLRPRLSRAGFHLQQEEPPSAGNFLVARLQPPPQGQNAG